VPSRRGGFGAAAAPVVKLIKTEKMDEYYIWARIVSDGTNLEFYFPASKIGFKVLT
jgi:hypothetical protein